MKHFTLTTGFAIYALILVAAFTGCSTDNCITSHPDVQALDPQSTAENARAAADASRYGTARAADHASILDILADVMDVVEQCRSSRPSS